MCKENKRTGKLTLWNVVTENEKPALPTACYCIQYPMLETKTKIIFWCCSTGVFVFENKILLSFTLHKWAQFKQVFNFTETLKRIFQCLFLIRMGDIIYESECYSNNNKPEFLMFLCTSACFSQILPFETKNKNQKCSIVHLFLWTRVGLLSLRLILKMLLNSSRPSRVKYA